MEASNDELMAQGGEVNALALRDEVIEGEFTSSDREGEALVEARFQPQGIGPIKRERRPDRSKVHAMRLFLAEFERTGDTGRSCRAAGITSGRLHNWRDIHPWFDTRIEALARTHIEEVESTAFALAKEGGDPSMTRWFLERRAAEKWGKSNDKGNGPPLTIRIEQTVMDAI